MGHDKLRKFAENETFSCLLQPSSRELLQDGFANLRDHSIKGNWNSFFARENLDLILELGCGKGEYTIALAGCNPDKCYIGVDIKGARLWKGAKYATRNAMPNVAFLRTKVEFITSFFAPGEVSGIWLTFSDPFYRSANSRLSSPLFLERYRRILRPGSLVRLKTDSMFLYQYTRAVCQANSLRIVEDTQDLYARPGDFAEELTGVQTFYEQLFREQGYPIKYISFAIDHEGAYIAPDFDEKLWREAEGPRVLFGHDSAETRRQKTKANDY